MSEFLICVCFVLSFILILVLTHKVRQIGERLSNVEFITNILRHAYIVDTAEKNVETSEDGVEND